MASYPPPNRQTNTFNPNNFASSSGFDYTTADGRYLKKSNDTAYGITNNGDFSNTGGLIYANGGIYSNLLGIGKATNASYPLDMIGDLRVSSGPTTSNAIVRLGNSGIASTQGAYIQADANNLYMLNQQPGTFSLGTNNTGTYQLVIDNTSVTTNGALTSTSEAYLAKRNNGGTTPQYIEFGTNLGLSYIDFHSNTNFDVDLDARITCSGGTTNNSGTGTLTFQSSGVTINSGLTLGGANNITLGSGGTAPTAGQLGYTLYSQVQTGAIVALILSDIGTTPSITAGAGVWMVSVSICFTATTTALVFAQLLVNRNGAGFTNENDSFCPLLTSTNIYTTANFTNIFTFPTGNNIIKVQAGLLTGASNSVSVEATPKFSYLKAVKIA